MERRTSTLGCAEPKAVGQPKTVYLRIIYRRHQFILFAFFPLQNILIERS